MLKFALLLIPLFLWSCSAVSPRADGTRSAVLQQGAAVADRVLEDAELVICLIAPAGAVERRYGASKDLAEARRVICARDPDNELFGPHGGS